MNEDDIAVTRSEQFATYRQLIEPPATAPGAVKATPEQRHQWALEVVATLLAVSRTGRVTGQIVINMNQGGVRNFIADQVARVADGSVADEALEVLFGK
jgi:hypothetical protein